MATNMAVCATSGNVPCVDVAVVTTWTLTRVFRPGSGQPDHRPLASKGEQKVTSKASDVHTRGADDVAEATGPTARTARRTPQRLPEGVWGAGRTGQEHSARRS